MTKLRVAGIVKESVVDGPGLRYVIFTQGCPHNCIGCHNTNTHDPQGGYDISLAELLASIKETKLIQGVTFTGGEPFTQAATCAELARLIKHDCPELDILTYTGYYYEDLLALAKKNPGITELLQATDILIDGPFEINKKTFTLPFRGSSNQNIISLATMRT